MAKTIHGTDADDTLDYGAGGGYVIYGGDGNDLLNTGGNGDTLYGGAGDDSLWGGTQSNTIDGGDGIDTLYWAPPRDDTGSWTLANYWDLGLTTSQYNPDYYAPTGMVNTITNVENMYIYNGASNRLTGSTIANLIETGEGNDTIFGLEADDTLIGNIGNDVLYGGSGSDYLNGGAGSDHAEGGDGDDWLSAGIGDDTLLGGAGNDHLHGGDGNDWLDGGDGEDFLTGGLGSDTIHGGADFNTLAYDWDERTEGITVTFTSENGGIVGGGGGEEDQFEGIQQAQGTEFSDVMAGNDGAQILNGLAGNDTLFGGAGDDRLDGGDGDDILNGGDGDDFLISGLGSDTINGGTGNNVLVYDWERRTEGVRITFISEDAGIVQSESEEIDHFQGIQHVSGTEFSDVMIGLDGPQFLRGLSGSDTLIGGDGDDHLSGGDGDDLLNGGSGENFLAGGLGSDTIHGGADYNTLAYDWDERTEGITVTFTSESGGIVGGEGGEEDQFEGIQQVQGTEFSDVITGNDGDQVLTGLAGNDTLIGGAGDDRLDGGAGDNVMDGGDGDDFLVSGLGSDTIYGGAGHDMLVYDWDPRPEGVRVTFTSEAGGIVEGEVGEEDHFQGIERVNGSEFDDVMTGYDGAQIFSGRSGNDTLIGGAGDDRLRGDEGNDVLDGGEGDDRLNGGDGSNTVFGGAGTDAFQFWYIEGHTLITDYEIGELLQFSTEDTDFDIGDLGSQITSEYNSDDNLTHIYVETDNIARRNVASVNGDFVVGSIEFDARWGDVNVRLMPSELMGDNIINGTNEDDELYGFDGNDTLDGLGGQDRFWGGVGDDKIIFGVDEISGEATRGRYFSEAGNDRIDVGGEWGWLRYDVVPGHQRTLINFTEGTLFFAEDPTFNGSIFDSFSASPLDDNGHLVITELNSFSVRDQFGDVDSYLNADGGAHFWGTAYDDVLVTNKHFWWSATTGNDHLFIIGDEGGTLAAPWESVVNWSLASTTFDYYGEDGNDYTILLAEGTLTGLAGGEGDDTLTGTDADEWFEGAAGENVVSGGGGTDGFYFWDIEGHTLITDYEIGELLQFGTENTDFDVDDLGSQITSEYNADDNLTHIYVETDTIARRNVASVNGDFVVGSIEFDERWGDVNVRLITAELTGDNIINGTNEDDELYGFGGNDTLDGFGGEDRFWGGVGDDKIIFGVNTISGEATQGRYYSEAGNDQIDVGGEWGWLRYDVVSGDQRALINFTERKLFFVEEALSLGSNFIRYSVSTPDDDGLFVIAELNSFSVRDQFGDIDSYLNADGGAHFWGTAYDDVFVTSKHFWWSATAGNDNLFVIGDEGGTLEAPWESGVDWSLASTTFDYHGEDGNDYTIFLAEGTLTGLAGGEGDDTLTGTDADEWFEGGAGQNVVSGGGGSDAFSFWRIEGHTLITDYEIGDRLNFGTKNTDFDFGNLGSQITSEYNSEDNLTHVYVETDTISRHQVASVNGDFVVGSIKYDARLDNVNVGLISSVLPVQFFANSAFRHDALDFGEKGSIDHIILEGDEIIELTAEEAYQAFYEGHDLLPEGINRNSIILINEIVHYNDRFSAYSKDGISSLSPELTGTFNHFGLHKENTNGNEFDWFVANVAVSAATLDDAVSTSSTTDDVALFTTVFDGNDQVYLSQFADSFDAGAGNDVMYGFDGNDTIYGGSGDDTLDGGAGENRLLGGEGNDRYIFAYDGTSRISDASGANYIVVTKQPDVYFKQLFIDGDSLVLRGTNDSELIYENYATLAGITWVPLLDGEWSEYFISMDDLFIGTNENDVLISLSRDYSEFYGGGGDDHLSLENGTAWMTGDGGNDTMIGGDGNDGLHGDLRADDPGDDVLVGNGGNDQIHGDAGNDTLYGGAGDDELFGGSGNDVLDDGKGTDYIDGGEGVDTFQRNLSLDYEDYTFTTVVNLAVGKMYALGYEDDFDTIVNIENVDLTGNFNDIIYGNSADNEFKANNGADTLYGGSGDDLLIGGAGNDVLDGGEGNDTASFSGNRSDYRIMFDATSGSYTVADLRLLQVDGHDTLTNIEFLAFTDGTFNVDHGSPGFEIVELSRSGSAVTYGLMVNPDVDPGEPGLGSFDFVLDYDPASLLFDADTIVFADGVTGLSGDHDTETGMVQFGGFVSDPAAPFSDFSKPLMQFEATITSRDTPVELLVADVLFDDVSVDGATASFDYSANSVTTVVTTRSGVVMEGVDVETVVLSQSGGMFLRATSVGNGVVQFELVAVPGASIGAVDFTISEASIAEFSLGPDLAGWTAEVNTDEPGVISVSAIGAVNGSLDLPSGEEVVLAKFTANGAIDLHVTDGMLGDVAQADVRVTSEAFATDVQGEMTSTFESGAQILVHADADFSNVAPTRAVTAQDALEALRLSVGMATTGGQSDAFAFIAADFNQSGKVNAHDALEILRYAVRAEGALDADWVFVDTNGDYSSIKRSSVEFEEGVAIASLTDDAEVYLTGILRGDVNDSISNMLL